MPYIGDACAQSDRQQRQCFGQCRVLANGLEAEQQTTQADATQHETQQIETRSDGFAPDVGDQLAHQYKAEHANRHVDVEDPAPVEIGDDKAAQWWSDQWSEKGR